MKRLWKKIWAGILLIFCHSGPAAEKSVMDGICDFSGQGRSRYGK